MARHRLLLVEDSPTDRLLIAGALAADPLGDYEIIEVDRLADAVGHLAGGDVDLVLLDLSLPDSSGEDTYRRTRAAAPDLPIVVCTGDDDEALGLRLLRTGADELLVKGAAVENLRRAVRHGIERAAARRWLSQREQLVRVDRLLALGTLVGGVAHEINNPTHAIMLSAQLLGKAWQDIQPLLDGHFRDDPGARLGNVAYSEVRTWIPEVIADIQNGAERIKSIVAALRDYAREERGNAVGSVDLNQVVRSALVLLSNRLKQATRAFSVEYGSGLPAVRGNARRLEQVVVGLVMNACDALDSAEQAIRLDTHCDEQTGRVTLVVEDQGRGIPVYSYGLEGKVHKYQVVFRSDASNLVSGAAGGLWGNQLYLYLRSTGAITLISHAAASPSTPALGGVSPNGHYVASGDGRWIAFVHTGALVAGQTDTNGGGGSRCRM